MPPYAEQLIGALGALWLIVGFALLVARGLNRVAAPIGYAGLWLSGSGALAAALAAPGVKAALLAIGLIAGLLQLRAGARRRASGIFRSKRSRSFKPWDHEAELLRLCHGDRRLMERLIRHEMERKPDLSRAGAMLAATTRLRHDKR